MESDLNDQNDEKAPKKAITNNGGALEREGRE